MSTFAKVMIGIGVVAGVTAGGGLLYYALRKEPNGIVDDEETEETDETEENGTDKPEVTVATFVGAPPQIP